MVKVILKMLPKLQLLTGVVYWSNIKLQEKLVVYHNIRQKPYNSPMKSCIICLQRSIPILQEIAIVIFKEKFMLTLMISMDIIGKIKTKLVKLLKKDAH